MLTVQCCFDTDMSACDTLAGLSDRVIDSKWQKKVAVVLRSTKTLQGIDSDQQMPV